VERAPFEVSRGELRQVDGRSNVFVGMTAAYQKNAGQVSIVGNRGLSPCVTNSALEKNDVVFQNQLNLFKF
jgi:hypothetical protein